MKKREIVVARYKENIDWLAKLPGLDRVTVMNCGKPVRPPAPNVRVIDRENKGRESGSYLQWICDNYERLNFVDAVVFCQGDNFDHSPDFLERLAHWYDEPTSLSAHYKAADPNPTAEPWIVYDEMVHGHHVRMASAKYFYGKTDDSRTKYVQHVWDSMFEGQLPDDLGYGFGALWHVPVASILGRPLMFWESLLDLCDDAEGEAAFGLEVMWYALWQPEKYKTYDRALDFRNPELFKVYKLDYEGDCQEPHVVPGALYCLSYPADETSLTLRWEHGRQAYCPSEEFPDGYVDYSEGELQIEVGPGIFMSGVSYTTQTAGWFDWVTATVTGLSPNTCYTFRVRFLGTGEAYSNEVECCTPPGDTFNEGMTGGVIVGGQAVVGPSLVIYESGSGGVVVGGSAVPSTYISTSGGVKAGGSAVRSGSMNIRGAGGVVVAGAKYLGRYLGELIVTVPSGRVVSDLTGFPLHVTEAVGGSLRVTRVGAIDVSGGPLPAELVAYDSATGRLHCVVFTALSAGSPTTVRIYFGE